MTPEISTRGLLDTLAQGESGESMSLGDLLDRFSARAFGVFLLLSLLPAFIPLPVGMGAISGPLVVLIGVQLLLPMAHPWVPGFIARRTMSQERLAKFREHTGRWLLRLEKLSRPRSEWMIDHLAARITTGVLVVVLGLLLALPIPFTNYPFGFILVVYAIALIERDGRMMMAAWALGLVEIVLFSAFFGQLWGAAASAMG